MKLFDTIKRWYKNFAYKFLLKLFGGLFVFYLLFSYFAVNPLAKKLVPWVAEKNLASKASVQQVKFDPFRLKATIDGLKLANLSNEQLLGFSKLIVDFELSGIFDRAWKFRQIGLFDPKLNFAISQKGELNWDVLLAKLAENKAPPSDTIQRVSIENIVISKGNVRYLDTNRSEPLEAELTPINFVLKGFSTLPKDRGDYAILAEFSDDGGSLKWKGDIGVNPLVSKGKLVLEGIKLPQMLQLVKGAKLPFEASDGTILTSFAYNFSMPKSSPKLLLNNLNIKLNDLAAQLAQGGDVTLKQASISTPQLDFFKTKTAEIHTQQLDLNLTDIVFKQGENTVIALKETTASMPKLDLLLEDDIDLKFDDLNFKLADLNIKKGETSLLTIPNIDVNQISLDLVANQAKINQVVIPKAQVHAARDINGVLDWQQAFVTDSSKVDSSKAEDGDKQEAIKEMPEAPVDDLKKNEAEINSTELAQAEEVEEVSGSATQPAFTFDIENIQMTNWALAFDDQSFKQPLSISTEDFNLNFAVNAAKGNLVVNNLQSNLQALQVKSATNTKPVAAVQTIQLSEGAIDLNNQKVSVAAIKLSGLNTSVARDAEGQVNWQAILAPVAKNAAPSKSTKQVNSEASSWQVELAKVGLDNADISIADNSGKTPVLLDIENAKINIKNASLDMQKPLPINAAFKVKQGGAFNTNGLLTPSPFKLNAKVKLAALSLKPFAPYVNQFALLKLNEGAVGVSGKLALKQSNALALKFDGGFSVNTLALVEEADDALFLSWDQLASDNLSVSLLPNEVKMGSLALNKVAGKFIINEDKSNNIAGILRQQTPVPDSTSEVIATAPENDSGFPVSIQSLAINDASLEFADLSLRPQFGTNIHSLNGVVNQVSTSKDVISKVDLNGRVDDYGSAKINGEVQPFDAANFTDLALDFVNLDMNRLTPYSGKFAGREIESGKMTVNLQYKINQKQLAGENKFIINKIKLGSKIESKDAVDLPLDLAIAILEDSDGLIDLDLPIAGSLDDPEFSYGSIVWKAIRNVLTKIVTAPFRALGSLFGNGDKKFDAIIFEAGQAEVSPPELEKLVKVTEVLAKRKGLGLGVVPGYDLKADALAIKQATYRRQVTEEMDIELAEGQTAGPVDLANPETQKAIDALYNDLTKKGFFKKLASKFEEPEEGHYEKAQQALIDSVEVKEGDLLALAKSRGEAIKSALLEKGLAPERLALVDPKKSAGKDGKVKTQLTLDVKKSAKKAATPETENTPTRQDLEPAAELSASEDTPSSESAN